jgi:LAGLIDADG-like domain
MPELFSAWTPAERWLAGLLWADGHITPSIGVAGHIVLNLTDRDVLDQAARVIGEGHRFHKSQPPQKPTHQVLHRLAFTDEAGALARLGFGPKPERVWPDEIGSAAFLRGLFDGDGSVGWYGDGHGQSQYRRAMICGPLAVVTGAGSWLAEQGVRPRDPRPHGSIWQLTWRHRDSLRLAEIMYSEPGPCMTRKRERFRSVGAP